jgi:transposase
MPSLLRSIPAQGVNLTGLKQLFDINTRVLYHATRGIHDMRRPAHIHPWLSQKELQAWVRKASSREEYQRRIAVWMTLTGPFPAHRIATLLVVSKQAVWLWVSQYNRLGPAGLLRQGRGGRHRAYLSLPQEAALLKSLQSRTGQAEAPTAKRVQAEVSKITRRQVSLSFAYRLLERIAWPKPDGRSRHPRVPLDR